MSTPLKELDRADYQEERPLGRILAVALTAIVLTTLGVWTWQFVGHGGAIVNKPSGPPPRIAVLAFDSFGKDARAQQLSSALRGALIGSLEASRKVVVLRSSLLPSAADSGAVDPVVAGHELHVEALLFGNLQSFGERLRIEVRLVSARDGRQLWAQRFEGDSSGISGLSERISESLARHLTALLD